MFSGHLVRKKSNGKEVKGWRGVFLLDPMFVGESCQRCEKFSMRQLDFGEKIMYSIKKVS